MTCLAAVFSEAIRTGTERAALGRLELTQFPESSHETPRRILVVDDNVGTARMLMLLLGKLGRHEVHLAHDGASALAQAQAHRPDLVLLDIGLPGMSGYDVAQRLREQPEFRETLLVALTGYGQEEDRRRSYEAGFDEHLVKPPSMDVLRSLFAHPKLAGRHNEQPERAE
jgi:CheY-like chemotaxis protein